MSKFKSLRNSSSKTQIFTAIGSSLTVLEVSELCFKSVRTVTDWNNGKVTIPPECIRLIRLYESRNLGISEVWDGFCMTKELLQLPTGQFIAPQQLLAGLSLLEVSSPNDIKILSKLLRIARVIETIKAKRR
ncbi:regulator [Vibrio fluminensis]|uniref:regulator n=1 Tax=Vibrio fluminensis TaxID=2783614 RepID=UPI0032AEE26F